MSQRIPLSDLMEMYWTCFPKVASDQLSTKAHTKLGHCLVDGAGYQYEGRILGDKR